MMKRTAVLESRLRMLLVERKFLFCVLTKTDARKISTMMIFSESHLVTAFAFTFLAILVLSPFLRIDSPCHQSAAAEGAFSNWVASVMMFS